MADHGHGVECPGGNGEYRESETETERLVREYREEQIILTRAEAEEIWRALLNAQGLATALEALSRDLKLSEQLPGLISVEERIYQQAELLKKKLWP